MMAERDDSSSAESTAVGPGSSDGAARLAEAAGDTLMNEADTDTGSEVGFMHIGHNL